MGHGGGKSIVACRRASGCLIAATRRILVLTAEFADVAGKPEPVFRNAMIELGLLTFLVLVMVVSLALLRGRRSGAVAERG